MFFKIFLNVSPSQQQRNLQKGTLGPGPSLVGSSRLTKAQIWLPHLL